MMEYVLHIVGHSADLKTAPTGSKDTGIFFPQDLIEFLGTDKDLNFTLYKEDCAQAMSSIISALPLYSNKGGKRISHTNIFDEATRMISMISNFFGESETAVYSKAYLSETSGGRRYLYGLEHNGFSIRKFLVADHSILKFHKEDNGNIIIRFQTKLKPNNDDNSNDVIVHNHIEKATSYPHYLHAIRTKPFLLLAGISGTGKSRIVRELAFKSCPKYLQDKDGTTPGNYCMIEVKPNWHDSTELLGYYSNLRGQYLYTKFAKFIN